MTSKQDNSTATLDQVFKAVHHWRNHKDQYDSRGIPDDIWKKIFQLEGRGYLPKDLKRTFSLNSKQYDEMKNKDFDGKQKLATKSNNLDVASSSDNDTETFCEVKIPSNKQPVIPALSDAAKKNKQAVTTLKSTNNNPRDYLDMTTMIVEYMRPDGHRLKIHTTTEGIDKVMSAFAKQGVQNND